MVSFACLVVSGYLHLRGTALTPDHLHKNSLRRSLKKKIERCVHFCWVCVLRDGSAGLHLYGDVPKMRALLA